MMPGMRRERAEVGSNIDAEIRGDSFPNYDMGQVFGLFSCFFPPVRVSSTAGQVRPAVVPRLWRCSDASLRI